MSYAPEIVEAVHNRVLQMEAENGNLRAENERLRALVVAVIDAGDGVELRAAIQAGIDEVGPTEIRTVRRR